MPLRVLMIGTGAFALPTLRALADSDHELVGLLTQPDRTGRGHHNHRNPMKDFALERGVPVHQPERINTDESVALLESLGAELHVVAAYGQILSQRVIDTPRLAVVNIHASLLPKYRGAAPIQHAILNGETETGITIFQIQPELDAGPILAIEKTAIGPKETAGQLHDRLAELAAPIALRVADGFDQGNVTGTTQDASLVTRAPRLKKSDGVIDWSLPAEAIERHIRAMQPWPKSFSLLTSGTGKPLRLSLLDAELADDTSVAAPGEVVHVDSERIVVQTGCGTLAVLLLQPDGKRVMETAEFLRGRSVQAGDRFESAIA